MQASPTMRVMITGEGGFTARYLAPLLVARGHTVIPLMADVRDRAAVAERARTLPDVVVHLAGMAFVPDSTDGNVYSVNTMGTTVLLEALAALPRPPRRVVLASSSHIYGAQPGRLTERTEPAPVTHYGASKYAMEMLSRQYAQAFEIIIARAFNYTGVGQAEHFLVPKLVAAFRARAPRLQLGNRAIARDFSDVRYIARAYHALLTQPRLKESVYNLCSGVPTAIGDILTFLESETGHKPEIVSDSSLMRANETPLQFGDPARVQNLVGEQPEICHVLRWMLQQSH